MKKNVFTSVVMGLVFLGLTELGASSLSYEKQIAAVKQTYQAIQKIGNSDKEIQLAAVEQETRAVKYKMQLAAVKQRYYAITH